MNKPLYKKWWFWVVLILIIGAIGNMIDPVEEKETSPVVTNEQKPKEEPVKDTIVKEEKKEEDLKTIAEGLTKKYLEDVELVKFNEDNGFLLIKGKGKENISNDYTVKGFKMSIFNIMNKIHEQKDIKTLAFNITYPLVDKYGNSSEQIVLKVEFSRSTLDKINYDNFDFNNIEDIADSYWEHQAIKE